MKKLITSAIKQIAIKYLTIRNSLFAIRYLLFTIYYLLFAICYLHAYSYLGARRGIGDMVTGHGLRSAAMGGTGIGGGDEPTTLLYNPASMCYLEQKQISLGLGFVPFTERIVTADKRTYYNEPVYFQINNIAAVLPFREGKFAVGLAYAPLYDHNYLHKQSLYSQTTPPIKVGHKELKTSGNTITISPAVSLKIGELFAIGLSYNMLSGANNYSYKEIDTTVTPNRISSSTINTTTSGGSVNFGVIFTGVKSLKIGLNYFGATSVKIKSKTTERKLDIPSYFGFGINWDFGGRFNTKLAFDFIPMPFSEAKSDGTGLGWSNINVLKIGVEHFIQEDMPLRFGYYSLPFYASRQIELVAFTLGVGYKFSENVFFDIMGEYGKRNFYGDNVFFEESEVVDESFKKLMFGAKYKW